MMDVTLNKKAQKQLDGLNEQIKGRILRALVELGNDPPEGDIKELRGRDGYRVRVGGYRILFKKKETCLAVYKISPRGQAYKEN
jgi:mRNA interferase RelE/StbE